MGTSKAFAAWPEAQARLARGEASSEHGVITSEAYYVENYGKLTQTEWNFLEPQVQEYNKVLLAQYGVDAMDLLIPIEMRLSDRLRF